MNARARRIGQAITVAEALLRVLSAQWVVDNGQRRRLIPGLIRVAEREPRSAFGTALDRVLIADPDLMDRYQVCTESDMIAQASGFARVQRRRGTLAGISAGGLAASELLVGAAHATARRLPVFLVIPEPRAGDGSDSGLARWHSDADGTSTTADLFRPVSRYFSRITEPAELFITLRECMGALTDPFRAGVVTLSIPEEVAAQRVFARPEEFEDRLWLVRRTLPDPHDISAAAEAIRTARTPVVIAGGGVLGSQAVLELRRFIAATGIPAVTTVAGIGALASDDPLNFGVYESGRWSPARALVARADVTVSLGVRREPADSVFGGQTQRIGINLRASGGGIADLDVVADAREGISALAEALDVFQVDGEYARWINAERERPPAADAVRLVEPAAQKHDSESELAIIARAAQPRDMLVVESGSELEPLSRLWPVFNGEYPGPSLLAAPPALGVSWGMGGLRAGPDRTVMICLDEESFLKQAVALRAMALEKRRVIVVVIGRQDGPATRATAQQSPTPKALAAQNSLRPVSVETFATGLGLQTIDLAEVRLSATILIEALAEARASHRSMIVHLALGSSGVTPYPASALSEAL